MNDVEVIVQRVNYANGYGIDMSLRHIDAGLEPFIVRQWHFKDVSTLIQSEKAITCLGKGMADTLGTQMICLDPDYKTDLQLDEDIYI